LRISRSAILTVAVVAILAIALAWNNRGYISPNLSQPQAAYIRIIAGDKFAGCDVLINDVFAGQIPSPFLSMPELTVGVKLGRHRVQLWKNGALVNEREFIATELVRKFVYVPD
jgi:hypothetical protein